MAEPGRAEREALEQLSARIDLVALMAQLGRRTKYGKKPHPTDPWGYTRAFLATYAPETSVEELVPLFEELGGARNEVQVGSYLGLNVKWLP